MTALVSVPLPSPALELDDRYVVVTDPRPGTIVSLPPGSQLAVRFRRGLGPSRWHATATPGHLVVLADRGHEFQFLVFGGADPSEPVRFERRHPEREIVSEVCELLVVPVTDPVSGGAGRTSTPASPRTA